MAVDGAVVPTTEVGVLVGEPSRDDDVRFGRSGRDRITRLDGLLTDTRPTVVGPHRWNLGLCPGVTAGTGRLLAGFGNDW